MLTGASILQLDTKGRLAIPSRYRALLMERCGGALTTTVSALDEQGKEISLWMYPRDIWKPVSEQVAKLSDFKPDTRAFKRMFLGYATDMEMDGNGRVLLPTELRKAVAITKGIYMLGQSNKFELWGQEKWTSWHDEWLAKGIDMDKMSPELQQLSL